MRRSHRIKLKNPGKAGTLKFLMRHSQPVGVYLATVAALSALGSAAAILVPIYTAQSVDALYARNVVALDGSIEVIVGLVAVGSVLHWAYFVSVASVGGRVVLDIRKALFDRIAFGDWESSLSDGEAVTRLQEDAAALVSTVVRAVNTIVSAVITVGLGCLMLFRMQYSFGLLLLALVPVYYFAPRVLRAKVVEAAASVRLAIAGAINWSVAVIGMHDFSVMLDKDSADWYRRQGSETWNRVRSNVSAQRYWEGVVGWIQGTISYGVVVAILAMGSLAIYRGNSGVAAVAFLLINGQLAQPIASLAQIPLTVGYIDLYQSRLARYMEVPTFALTRVASPGIAVSVEGLRAEVAERTLWNNVHFAVGVGEHWLLTGNNGTGKSYLMRAMLGLAPVANGKVRWEDSASIQYVPQIVPILPTSLVANVAMGIPVREEDVRDLLTSIGWTGPMDLGQLYSENLTPSRGERQRIGIARMLLRRPNVVLLDEIEEGVDDPHLLIERILRAVPTVIAVTHHPELWPSYCGRIVMPMGLQ